MNSLPISAISALLSLSVLNCIAADKTVIIERGANHQIIQTTAAKLDPSGESVTRITRYTQLETGLNYRSLTGKWVESQEIIEPYPEGAIAQHGQHRVTFLQNINSLAAVNLTAPDGKQFKTHVFGISYFDPKTGNTALIAEITNAVGVIVPPNQVIYSNAFTDIKADVRYTYTKQGFEQDIIFNENPPSPEVFGLDPNTTRLEVLTEYDEPVSPHNSSTNSLHAGSDVTLNFGAMQIISGAAFLTDPDIEIREAPLQVAKMWINISGRQFLIESVPYSSAQRQLTNLLASVPTDPAKLRGRRHAGRFPLNRNLVLRKGEPIKIVQPRKQREVQFVLDYSSVISSTNYTFQSDTTYYVSGTVNLNGTTTFEGGTVIKFANTNSAQLKITGANGFVRCVTQPYRPVIFTAKDDNTLGDTISGSSGTPSGTYAAYGLYIDYNSTALLASLNNLRISYANVGIKFNGGTGHVVTDAQFVNCGTGILGASADASLRNALFYNVTNGFNANGGALRAEHLTVNQENLLVTVSGGTPNICLTNCLLVAVTNLGSGYNYYTNSVGTESNPGTVFQTVGAGSHYLVTNSVYRNAGTVNIDSTLRSALRSKTTYPPIVYFPSGYFSSNLTLFPQAQRGGATPDLGYCYDPLDYAFGFAYLTNCTITVQAGTAIGMFTPQYGLCVADSSTLICEGNPTNRIQIARYNTAQEQSNTNWTGGAGSMVATTWYQVVPPTLRFRFTDWSVLANDTYSFHGYASIPAMESIQFLDCNFRGASWISEGAPLGATNCLFERVSVQTYATYSTYGTMLLKFRNNLFYRGQVQFFLFATNEADFYNNLFDQTTFQSIIGTADNGFNGYITGFGQIPTTGPSNVVVDPISYDVGPLGNYYLSQLSALINAGNSTAEQVGLYHYTTSLLQEKETNSVVDIGLHYVACTSQTVTNTLWVDDFVPGTSLAADNESWTWTTNSPGPLSGTKTHLSTSYSGEHQHYFWDATNTLSFIQGDILYSYIYITATNVPSQIVLQFYGTGDGWNHRAYWGTDTIGWNPDVYLGPIPPAGQWVRLSVPVSTVQLEGKAISGMAFTMVGGSASWDSAGKYSIGPIRFPDGDGDGLPDYLEDRNGNGTADSGETSWLSADTDSNGIVDEAFAVRITWPRRIGPLQ